MEDIKEYQKKIRRKELIFNIVFIAAFITGIAWTITLIYAVIKFINLV